MDILERWHTTFAHEEPDYVSSFVQVIMSKIKMLLDDKFGDDFTEEDLCITPLGDYTLRKWCGFESSWGAHVPYKIYHPDVKPTRYQVQKNGKWVYVEKLPAGTTRYRIEQWNGRISEVMGDNRDINFYVDGNLYVGPGGAIDQKEYDPKATMDLWTERHESRDTELLEDAAYENILNNLKETVEKHNFMPVFGLAGFVEGVRESFGIQAWSRFLHTNPEVIAHAAKFQEKTCVMSAKAAAKAGVPFCIVADDIAYKHGVFCSPRHYKKFFSPIYRKMADNIHKAGGKIFFHSDGYTEPYWDTWINDCKFDGQESLEPQAWWLPDGEGEGKGANLKKPGRVIRYLKEKYGDRFVLLGNMDMSTVMPLATPEEVKMVTKDIIESGAPGGGFVFACCTDITEATPLENIVAMREAYRKYRHCYD
ncbi:MAG: uroporphyrinogen decarboxylase family protein [Candidatus Hodarchaeota archaeon]